MKRFKLKTGHGSVYDISVEEFERATKKQFPYVQNGSDGKIRYFAICPACDNPTQMIGLYHITATKAYARHYNRSVLDLAAHNESAYLSCPYAAKNYMPPDKIDRKTEFSDYEQRIYNEVRENFDSIIRIIERDTGVIISLDLAKRLIADYYNSKGWLYPWATLYNLPWIFFYLCRNVTIYGRLIKKKSALFNCLSTDESFILEDVNEDLVRVKTKAYSSANFYFTGHRRTVVDDEVKEKVSFELFDPDDCGDIENALPIFSQDIYINEYMFPNEINRKTGKSNRDKELLELAKQVLPKIISD